MANEPNDKTMNIAPAPRHTCDGRGGKEDAGCAGCLHEIYVEMGRETPSRAWRRIGG